MKLIRKKEKGERGQSLVEFTMVVPIFLILVFGIVDFGMGFHAWITTTNAAREGARIGAVGADSSTIDARVRSTAGSLNDTNLTVTITNASNQGGDPGETVTVDVKYNYKLITPVAGIVNFLSGGTMGTAINFNSTSKMRIE